MALHRYTVHSGSGGTPGVEALGAATAETVLQLVTGATRMLAVVEIGLSFNSVTSTDVPAVVEWLTQTSAGTSTAFTPQSDDPTRPAAISTALHHFTAEPSGPAVRRQWYVPVVGGLFDLQLPLDREIIQAVSTRGGLRVTSPSAVSCLAYVTFEE